MGAISSLISSLTIVFSTVYSDADQRKHQSSASLAIVQGIHRGPVNSPHKWPVTRKMFPFNDVIIKHARDYVMVRFDLVKLHSAVESCNLFGHILKNATNATLKGMG